MTGEPKHLLLLARPDDSDDMYAQVDGARSAGADLQSVRSFLGRWKVAARPVDASRIPTFIALDAVLLEIPTRERDEDGRVEPLALWVRTPMQMDAVAAASTFASSIGRSFDEPVTREELDLAKRAQSRLAKEDQQFFRARRPATPPSAVAATTTWRTEQDDAVTSEAGRPHRSLVEPPVLSRRRVLVLREEEYDKATYEAPDLLADPETWVINYDAAARAAAPGPALERLIRSRLLRPDQVLLLSPYDDAYVPAQDAEEQFSLRKFEIFTTLCYLLGAIEVVATRVDLGESTRHQGANLGGGRAGVKLETEATRELREKVEQRLKLSASFETGQPNTEAAADLLARHGLLEDSTMHGLLELFEIDGSRVKTKELVLNVTSEASREVKAVASLKIPAALAISASFRDLAREVQELLVTLQVTFR